MLSQKAQQSKASFPSMVKNCHQLTTQLSNETRRKGIYDANTAAIRKKLHEIIRQNEDKSHCIFDGLDKLGLFDVLHQAIHNSLDAFTTSSEQNRPLTISLKQSLVMFGIINCIPSIDSPEGPALKPMSVLRSLENMVRNTDTVISSEDGYMIHILNHLMKSIIKQKIYNHRSDSYLRNLDQDGERMSHFLDEQQQGMEELQAQIVELMISSDVAKTNCFHDASKIARQTHQKESQFRARAECVVTNNKELVMDLLRRKVALAKDLRNVNKKLADKKMHLKALQSRHTNLYGSEGYSMHGQVPLHCPQSSTPNNSNRAKANKCQMKAKLYKECMSMVHSILN